MGKIRQIGRRSLKKDFLVRFGGTFLTVLALPSALLSIVGTHFSLPLTVCLVIVALSSAAIINRKHLLGMHLPVEDILAGDIEALHRLRIKCPCDIEMTSQVALLAQYWFKDESISPEKYEALRVKNPKILACLADEENNFLGYFDVIPLKPSFAKLFVEGRVSETDLTHADIYSETEMVNSEYIYVSGLAVWNPDTPEGRRNAYILVWGMLKYLDHFYGSSYATAIASAITNEGERLLQKFKLQLATAAHQRRDGHGMYILSLSGAAIQKRLACLADYSSFCTLDWSTDASFDTSPANVPNRLAARRHLRLVHDADSGLYGSNNNVDADRLVNARQRKSG